jgi:hypothetical protein
MADRLRRSRSETSKPAAAETYDVVEIVVKDPTGRTTKRNVQRIVVENSCNARPGSARGVGAVTSKTIDVAAIVAMHGAATPKRKAGMA